jgi:hypothetical protein
LEEEIGGGRYDNDDKYLNQRYIFFIEELKSDLK